jgi:hypothetical protein
MILIIVVLLFISIHLAFKLKTEKNKVKWFEEWGRKYVEKHRDEARRDGITK